MTGGGGGSEQDLTGFWQDDTGGKYQIRQMGNQIWWYMDNMPAVANVFKGSIFLLKHAFCRFRQEMSVIVAWGNNGD